MSLRLRDLQQILGKFTDGNKGTAISDCFIYMENDRGGLNEIGKIELQESKIIGRNIYESKTKRPTTNSRQIQ